MTLKPENFRSSKEYREILRILQKASALQENFIWQSNVFGKNIIPIHHFEIDFVSREVVLYYDSRSSQVDLSLPLYVKLDYRSSVFKIIDYRHGTNSLHFPFPLEIKTQELRLNPRYLFSPEQERSVTLKPSISSGRESMANLIVRAVDVSQYGLGLIVSEQNRSFIKNNRILWVTELHGLSLPHAILAEVVYINNELEPRYLNRRQKELKVGLKLSGVFPETIFRRFIEL